MKTNLFIPEKLVIGFNDRKDTFTGRLAYIIYYDEKGVLRKKKSWESWCDSKIRTIEMENIPHSGFVVNKGVERYSDWGNSGRSMIRIHDVNNFEFEISVDNMLSILSHSDVSSSEIEEKCVYAWNGPELILLPCNSVAYQESIKFTDKQSEKVSTKDLKVGFVYPKKKEDVSFMYVGFMPWYKPIEGILNPDGSFMNDSMYKEIKYGRSPRTFNIHYSNKLVGNRHIFYNMRDKNFELVNVSLLSNSITTECVEEYAEVVSKFRHTVNSSKIKTFNLCKLSDNRKYDWSSLKLYFQENDKFNYGDIGYHTLNGKIIFDNFLMKDESNGLVYSSYSSNRGYYSSYSSYSNSKPTSPPSINKLIIIERMLDGKSLMKGEAINCVLENSEYLFQNGIGSLCAVLENGNMCNYNFY